MWTRRERAAAAALVIVGTAAYAFHADAWREWLVDDAGISFAYARNFALGRGLVAQLGDAPVEGYSNPTWVLVVAALVRMHAFVVPLTPKIVAAALVAATFALVVTSARRMGARPWAVATMAIAMCASNISFVMWCASGLENPLLVALVLALEALTLRALDAPSPGRAAAWCGVVAALVAATRPDAILYAIVPAAVFAWSARLRRRALLGAYAATAGGLVALGLALRASYFHALVPNTYFAKGGAHPGSIFDVRKLWALLGSAIADPLGGVTLFVVVALLIMLGRRGALTRAHAVRAIFTAVALVAFMALPEDWMAENRFATAFYPLYYGLFFSLVACAIERAPSRVKGAYLVAIGLGVWLFSLPGFCARTLYRARKPQVSLAFVRRAFGDRFARYGRALGVTSPTVLLPDVGAVLLDESARVVDLAGLCDATIARTWRSDRPRALDYVFDSVRPTFIHVYAVWAREGRFEEDPRFTRDYVAIHAYTADEEPQAEGHASGIFVRRDVVLGHEEVLASLRAEPHRRQLFLPVPARTPTVRILERVPAAAYETDDASAVRAGK
jgi:hypothetical protein